MIEINDHLEVDVDLDKIWSKIDNIEFLPKIFPEIEKVEILDRKNYRAILWFNTKIGFTKVRFEANSELIEIVDKKYILSKIDSKYIELKIRFEFDQLNGKTKISYNITGVGKGNLGKLLENALKRLLTKNRNKIKERVAEVLKNEIQ